MYYVIGPATGGAGHQLAVVAYRSCWLYWSPIGWSARVEKVAEGEAEEERRRGGGTEKILTTTTLTVGNNNKKTIPKLPHTNKSA